MPKGPSLDPGEKRLAMQVEDHPLDYADFEGVIPAGEYGGGTVMVWDRGWWKPADADVDAMLRRGRLELALHGRKLGGGWLLVRTRGRGRATKPAWLLIKRHDEHASEDDVAMRAPRSVASKRLMAEIAWQEGGDVMRAATADPPDEVKKLLANPRAAGRRRRTPSVWHSNRAS